MSATYMVTLGSHKGPLESNYKERGGGGAELME